MQCSGAVGQSGKEGGGGNNESADGPLREGWSGGGTTRKAATTGCMCSGDSKIDGGTLGSIPNFPPRYLFHFQTLNGSQEVCELSIFMG